MIAQCYEKSVWVTTTPVIASQSADWRGNPFPLVQTIYRKSPGIRNIWGADCHTSDIGHWLAMTPVFLTLPQKPAGGSYPPISFFENLY